MNHDPYLKLKGRGKVTARFMQASGHWTQFHESITPLSDDGGAFTTCQWLYGEPKARVFCCKPVQKNSSWCPEHHAICWTKSVLTQDF